MGFFRRRQFVAPESFELGSIDMPADIEIEDLTEILEDHCYGQFNLRFTPIGITDTNYHVIDHGVEGQVMSFVPLAEEQTMLMVVTDDIYRNPSTEIYRMPLKDWSYIYMQYGRDGTYPKAKKKAQIKATV